MMKVIWLSNLLTLTVYDEGYARNALCTLNKILSFTEFVGTEPLEYHYTNSIMFRNSHEM